jgi:hypothetical protein
MRKAVHATIYGLKNLNPSFEFIGTEVGIAATKMNLSKILDGD